MAGWSLNRSEPCEVGCFPAQEGAFCCAVNAFKMQGVLMDKPVMMLIDTGRCGGDQVGTGDFLVQDCRDI